MEPEILFKKISDLDLSVRTKRCLSFLGIKYIKDLIQHSAYDLKLIPGFGSKSFKEIKEFLKEHGLKLNKIPEDICVSSFNKKLKRKGFYKWMNN